LERLHLRLNVHVAEAIDAPAEQSPDADLPHREPRARRGLELRELTKEFGNVVAVDRVSLSFDHGEYIVLLGPSGCGKTTILRMIGGHEQPTSGLILLDGRSIAPIPPAKRPTTTVFQHFALFPHRTVLGNVEFGLQMHGLGRRERRQRALETIELVGLRELAHRRPRELSGGQQQRVALARVLVTKPQLLLLDEPFGDLDRLLQLRMRVELRELQRELGITFIHVTHNQEEALSMADRIVVMEGGHVMQVGTPVEIARRPQNVFVAMFMGDNNLLRGTITGRRSGELVIDVGIGELVVPEPEDVHWPAGHIVAVAIRASAIELTFDATGAEALGPNELRCVIKATEYLGDTIKVHLEAGDRQLLAKAPEDRLDDLLGSHGKEVVAQVRGRDVQLLDV
jgi:ABC-type Fe3+/spermidine/putrescine transport system ATPase subunit